MTEAADASGSARTRQDDPPISRTHEAHKVAEWGAVAALGCFSIVFVGRTAFSFHGIRTYSLFDDAMISMRYARNLATGHGLNWNTSGRPVEGYTDFLWTLWMAVVHLFSVPERFISAVVALSGSVLLLANLLFVRAITRRLAPRVTYLPALAMWLVAAYYPLVYWTLRGMEVGLVATLSSAAVVLAIRLRERDRTSDLVLLCVTLSAAVLTRTDTLLPVFVISVWLVSSVSPGRRRMLAAVLGAAIVGTFAAQSAFRIAYYGSFLPNTYYLKLAHIPLQTRLRRGVGGLISMGSTEFYGAAFVALAYLASCARRVDRLAWLLASLFIGQCAYSAYVGGDAWEASLLANRYLASEATPLLILAVIGAHAMLAEQNNVRRRIAMTSAGLGVVVFAIRAVDWRPASRLQLGRMPTEWWVPRLGLPGLFVGAMVIVALSARPRSDTATGLVAARPPPAVAVLCVVAVLAMCVSTRELLFWSSHNAFLQEDTNSALLGLSLREATPPRTVIAFAAAGASAYFSHRPAIDEGGKSDSVIAREAPRVTTFVPGHDKYDLVHSVRDLRPDVVIILGGATATDLRMIRSWGYEEITARIYLREGDTAVDRTLLARAGPYA